MRQLSLLNLLTVRPVAFPKYSKMKRGDLLECLDEIKTACTVLEVANKNFLAGGDFELTADCVGTGCQHFDNPAWYDFMRHCELSRKDTARIVRGALLWKHGPRVNYRGAM